MGNLRIREWVRALPRSRWFMRRVVTMLFFSVLLGSSAIPAEVARRYHFVLAVAEHTWDLVGWEIDALSAKLSAWSEQPADDLPADVAPTRVKEYLDRAARIGAIEGMLAQRAILPAGDAATPSNAELLVELEQLRTLQESVRPKIEQVIERQVREALEAVGFRGIGQGVWPPVSFTFVEPPKKLVVSRRDRIETIYSQMLATEMSLAEIEAVEAEIRTEINSVGYVTDIGGLGAFPTMVVDQASLRWVLSTVAHEWVHNYLVFYPLGWNYFASQDLTTMNETTAEIVGNEIGDLVLAKYYPELVPPEQPVSPPDSPEQPAFEFQLEMRLTRLEVDRLLALGEIIAAEAYMEERRQEFVANGYPLRVLNQAYFAFHGSYGTSPASTSPIGPKMERLRDLMPDVETFLVTVRSFTEVADLEAALAEWQELGTATR